MPHLCSPPPALGQSNTAPAAPTNLAATHNGNTVTATWDAPNGATKYHVTYSFDNKSSWVGAACGDNCTTNSYTVTAADPGKTYIVAVRAGNQHGWSGWVNSAPAVPANPPPAAPASITVTRADGSVTASWSAVPGATRYHVTYTSDNKKSWSGPPCADNCAGTSVTITGADNAKTYVVGVRAGNSGGWSGWVNSAASGPSAPPPAPAQIRVQRGCDKYLHVSWDAVPGATGYDVNYSVNNRKSWKRDISNTPYTAFQTHKANPNKTYWFAARALNSAGASGWTNSAAVAPPCAIHNLSASYAAGEISLAWNAANQADGYNVNFSPDGGDTWERVASGITAPSHSFNKDTQTTPYSSDFMVAVQAQQGSTTGHWYNAPVTVAAQLTVQSPSDTSVRLTLSGYSGQWWYRANLAPDDSCLGPVAGNSVTRSGLDEHGNYTYTAYSDGNCANALASITVVPSIDDLQVSAVTNTTASLNISHHTAAWWYQANLAPDTACTGVAANVASVGLTNLTPATEYTYKAYNDSNCNTAIASETFTTPGILISATKSIAEGSTTGNYPVRLATQPSHDVTVTIAAATTGDNIDPNITVKDTDDSQTGDQTTAITFTNQNWNTGRLVYLSVSDDADNLHGLRDIIHTAASVDPLYNGTTSTLTVHEIDDDPGIHLVPPDVTVPEGGSATYRVTLNTLPTSTVNVALTATGDDDITFSPTSVSFTGNNFDYLVGKTITVSATADTDISHGTKTITHTAGSLDNNYNGLTATLTATEGDTTNVLSATGITITTATLDITNHPSPWWYQRAAPSGDATCHSVAANTATAALSSLSAGVTYTYKAYDKSGCSSVDEIDSVTFTTTTNIVLSSSSTTIVEGGTKTYTVKLAAAPTQDVSIAVTAATTGSNTDSNITIKDTDDAQTGDQTTSIVFTSSTWNTARTVTLAAGEDNDILNGIRDIIHTATSADPNYSGSTITLTASEIENDAGISVTPTSLTVTEGGSSTYTVRLTVLPTSTVNVALTATGDGDITFNPTSLSFTGSGFDYIIGKTVTVSAAADTDSTHGSKTITHTITSLDSNYNGLSVSLTATESDTTPGFSVSAVTATGATLELANYTNAWSYKPLKPSSSCVTVSAGTTSAALTLTTDTFYAYEAYTGSGCTAANKISTEHFATTDVFVTNLKGAYSTPNPDTAQPPPGYSPVGRFSHNYSASNTDHKPGTKFTTGAVSGGNSKFTLKSVTGRFGDNNGAPSGMRFSLYSVGGSGNPDTELARLSSQRPLNSGWYTFTCTDGASGGFTSNCDLQPNTSYFVVAIIEDSGLTKWFRLRDTDSDADLTLPSTSGWSMANSRKQWTSGGYQQYWGVGTAGWFDRTEVPLLLIAADEKP